MFASCPARLFTSVTLTWLAMSSPNSLARNLFERLAALRRDVVRRTHVRERADGGANDVDRVARAVALRQHVAHTGAFEHRAHAAARDDARTFRGRLHQDASGAVRALDGVVERVVLQADVDHLLARLGHRLADGDRHFARLAEAVTDAARAVTDDGQRRKAELTATLDDLRRAIDRDQLLDKLVGALGLFNTCHVPCLS